MKKVRTILSLALVFCLLASISVAFGAENGGTAVIKGDGLVTESVISIDILAHNGASLPKVVFIIDGKQYVSLRVVQYFGGTVEWNPNSPGTTNVITPATPTSNGTAGAQSIALKINGASSSMGVFKLANGVNGVLLTNTNLNALGLELKDGNKICALQAVQPELYKAETLYEIDSFDDNGNKTGTFTKGIIVSVLDEDGDFVLVIGQGKNGKTVTGWVMTEDLKKIDVTPSPSPQGEFPYKGVTLVEVELFFNGESVGILPAGEEVTVLDERSVSIAKQLLIEARNIKGWVSARDIEKR